MKVLRLEDLRLKDFTLEEYRSTALLPQLPVSGPGSLRSESGAGRRPVCAVRGMELDG